MNRTPLARLTPRAAGELQHHCECISKRLHELARYHEEFDQQLKALIGPDATLELHQKTADAVLLAALKKEVAA
jgi:hypothetical protein